MRDFTVAFDLDGTLVDTMPRYTKLAVDLLTERYPFITPVRALELYLSTVGRSFKDQLRLIFPMWHETNAAVEEEFERAKLKLAAEESTRAHFAAQFAVQSIRAQGGQAVVVTSARRTVARASLESAGFQHVTLSGLADLPPKADRLKELAGWAKTEDRQLFFVGDTPYDWEIAMVAGCEFIGVRHSFPTYVFNALGAKSVRDLTVLWHLIRQSL